MNNKIIKSFILLLVVFLFNLKSNVYAINEYTNYETGYKVLIEDDANLLSESEISKLQKEMISLTKYGNIVFKTINKNSTSTSIYASNYYYEKFGIENGSLFLIDMDKSEIYIFSNGQNYEVITKSKAIIITDNVYNYATKKKYYQCVSKAFKQIYEVLNGNKILEPMRYISNIFISLMISFFTIYLTIFFKIKNKKTNQISNIEKANVKFCVGDVDFQKIGQVKEFSPSMFSSSNSFESNDYDFDVFDAFDDLDNSNGFNVKNNSSNNSAFRRKNSSPSIKKSFYVSKNKNKTSGGGGGHRF